MIGEERWPLVGAAGMRALDRHTIETIGVPAELLMESAGRAVAEAALELRPRGAAVDVLVGPGSNGGDGLVAARHLQLLGVAVRALCVGDPAALRGEAGANAARARAAGVALQSFALELAPAALLVDAIFGTGLARPVEGVAARAIDWIEAARARGSLVLAVDLPSGLDADTGQPLGRAVCADATLTLGLPKLGLAQEPGRSLAGRVRVARIGIADSAPGLRAEAELWTRAGAGRRLPPRPRAGHKGSFGHVLVVAGSVGKTGAAALAAAGAGRVGAGLVTVACPAGLNDVMEGLCTEAMTAPVPDTKERCFAAGAEDALLGLAETRDVVALGPGIGTHPETVSLVRALAARLERPLVLDADGLNALGNAVGVLKARSAPSILTPHPGEAGRLLGISTQEVNRDRVGAARRLAESSGGVVLLKGAASVIAAPDGRVVLNPTGGPALATGGTGDVLTGVVVGLLAQGLDARDAAALGAFVHGLAADRLAARRGGAGLLAGDVAAELPATLRTLRRAAEAGDDAGGGGGKGGGRRAGAGRLSLPFPEP